MQFNDLLAQLAGDININITKWDSVPPKYYTNPYDIDNVEYLEELLSYDRVPKLSVNTDHPLKERLFFMPKYSN